MDDLHSYDLIIDARCPREFAEDHIPGAVNLPVVNDEEYAEVGTLHRTDAMGAYQIGVQYSLRNIARHLSESVAGLNRKSRILVYCFRGGKRSRLWFDALDVIGYRVDKLKGGWKGYRRWVNEQLKVVPGKFQYNVLNGPTGCGKTRLLTALRQAGAQVLDLEELAAHRGSVIGALPGRPQPPQKYFDSLLLDNFSSYSPDRPIWVEAESKKIGNVQLPESLLVAMRASNVFSVKTAMAQRVRMWREDYAHFEDDPAALVTKLQFLGPLVGNAELKEWENLAERKAIPELFERLMTTHYDVAYKRSSLRNYPQLSNAPVIALDDLSPEALGEIAKLLAERW
ncbi:MAG: tRNA 2-selenouridine(34) synthase MnmH [Pseudomonadota bacterium]